MPRNVSLIPKVSGIPPVYRKDDQGQGQKKRQQNKPRDKKQGQAQNQPREQGTVSRYA